ASQRLAGFGGPEAMSSRDDQLVAFPRGLGCLRLNAAPHHHRVPCLRSVEREYEPQRRLHIAEREKHGFNRHPFSRLGDGDVRPPTASHIAYALSTGVSLSVAGRRRFTRPTTGEVWPRLRRRGDS